MFKGGGNYVTKQLSSQQPTSCRRHGEGTAVNKTASIRVWLQQLKAYVNNFATASSAKVGRCFIFRTAFLINFDKVPQNRGGLISVLSIAAHYGLDGPGSNLRGTNVLPAVKTVPEAHSDSCSEYRGFPGDKAAAAY